MPSLVQQSLSTLRSSTTTFWDDGTGKISAHNAVTLVDDEGAVVTLADVQLDANGRLLVLPSGQFITPAPTLVSGDKALFLFGSRNELVVGGPTAAGAGAAGNPVQVGGITRTANAYSTGTQRQLYDTKGAAVTRPHSIPEHEVKYAAASGGIVNTTTAVTAFAAAGSGIKTYITGIQIKHGTLGAATEFAIRDGAGGTVIWRTILETAAEHIEVVFPNPLASTANTLVEIVTLTASVTGGVYANLQGYQAQ